MIKFKDILGINSRYLDFILKYNSQEKMKFADSKLKTKQYLQARGIPVPKLHAIIDSYENLKKFDFNNLPNSTVIKPNQGSRGRGIIPFKQIKTNDFITVNEKHYTTDEIKSHIADIIDGKYSLGNIRDKAFFEQRIITDKSLQALSYKGLPDIRIIVYKETPAMAMLRLPNKQSDGKANLDAGAYGFGIDLATGKLTYMIKDKQIYQNYQELIQIPNDFKVPYFDEILNIVCECQKHTGLGFLGCDIAIDQNNGPVLIETNARPGLSIQLANKAGLKKRLIQINQIKTKNISQKIQTAKSLFSDKSSKPNKENKERVLGSYEKVNLIDHKKILTGKINPTSNKNFIPQELYKQLKIQEENPKIKIRLGGLRQSLIFEVKKGIKEIEIGIGNNQNYLYNHTKKEQNKLPSIKVKKPKFEFYFKPQINYGEVDFQIHQISKKLKILSKLTPKNLESEIKKFKENTNYNPQFEYEDFSDFLFENIKKLRNIKVEGDVLGQIFFKKIKYLEKNLKMIACIGTEQYSEASLDIYRAPTIKELELAEKHKKNSKQYDQSTNLSANEAKKIFLKFAESSKLKNIEVQIKNDMISDVSVNKKGTIFLNKNAKFNEQRIEKLIAHEIETHIYTAINGKDQPYQIFQDGLANYLYTQEGLAVYNQEKQLGFKEPCHGANTLINNNLVYQNSFANGYKALKKQGLSDNEALKACLKTKRGLNDTSQKGGSFKPSVYFIGVQMITKFLNEKGDYNNLYIGKINIEDIKLIKQVKSLNPAKLLPRCYQKIQRINKEASPNE